MLTASPTLTDAQMLYDNGQYQAAVDILSTLLASHPGPEAAKLLGDALLEMDIPEGAVQAYEFASDRMPEPERDEMLAQAAFIALSTGNVTSDSPQFQKYIAALAASPVLIHLQRAAEILLSDTRNPLAVSVLQKLRTALPDDSYIRLTLLRLAREHCNYPIVAAEEPLLLTELLEGKTDCLRNEPPHSSIMWTEDEALNRLASSIGSIQPITPEMQVQRRTQPHIWGDKIRIGYLSCDLWDDHATMRLFRSVLTAHDPARFDVTLFCYTPEKLLSFDQGGRKDWGNIISIEAMNDDQAASTIRSKNIDILVDLKGHTRGTRSQLMNRPLALVHVQWLGFPGTCVEVDCDYAIGDRFVLPDSSAPFYHEKFCRLPECYQPNDPVHRPLPSAAKRTALGLPADRVIIAAFNAQRKNSLHTMALWAEVLKANPKAILWLMVDGNHARQATAAHFKTLGIKQSQLMFAPKMAYAGHLARVQAADFAIDTFPCNGHTTTSDMLWAGLPVITKRGGNFASRVSESLLHAIGLAELVAEDDAAFVELATSLINSPERLANLKTHLNEQRFHSPLFDSERFCRHLERAFEMMVDSAKAGLEPQHFDVPALPSRIGSFESMRP
ncbi:putative O-linked N-acetylglucosamine transferase (SPINDLY family) [Agrobacterium vitis]|nr:putative O-linked N-acetylglucosamine transferase (SPINDLY family) [Agrobacterium vitis]